MRICTRRETTVIVDFIYSIASAKMKATPCVVKQLRKNAPIERYHRCDYCLKRINVPGERYQFVSIKDRSNKFEDIDFLYFHDSCWEKAQEGDVT